MVGRSVGDCAGLALGQGTLGRFALRLFALGADELCGLIDR